MQIGKLSFGIRGNTANWKRYAVPRETQGKFHPYFAWGIWWLGFYLYYPRKCPKCKEWMPGTGGIDECDHDGKILRIVCWKCHEQ